MKSLRIAFLTHEFVTVQKEKSLGLAAYVNRITQSLKDLGHEPEIFVLCENISELPSVIYYNNIRINHVKIEDNINLWLKIAFRFNKYFLRSFFSSTLYHIRNSILFSIAVEKRQKDVCFDLIHGTNCYSSILFIKKNPLRKIFLRLSGVRELWFKTENKYDIDTKITSFFEMLSAKKSDFVYAPSKFVADYCKKRWGIKVGVIRPPIFLETSPSKTLSFNIPNRFLIHFGQISYNKGSDILAKALLKVWTQEPDFKMVWAGPIINLDFHKFTTMWGNYSKNVIYTGSLSKNELFYILNKALASVFPTRVDNLPNAVIESLLFKVPVIGSNGASIDELVENGKNGELFTIGDSEALSKILIDVWREKVSWLGKNFVFPELLKDFSINNAVEELLKTIDMF